MICGQWSQQAYVQEQGGFWCCQSFKYQKSVGECEKNVEPKPFRELVGSLMYLAVATRPDIAHAVSVFSQFNNSYSDVHWQAARTVLRHLKDTSKHALSYSKSGCDFTLFTDSDW